MDARALLTRTKLSEKSGSWRQQELRDVELAFAWGTGAPEVMQEFLRSHSSSIRWLMLLDGAHNGAHIKAQELRAMVVRVDMCVAPFTNLSDP